MHVNPINHDFDEANQKPINWEEHIGLAVDVATMMTTFNSRLAPYRQDIVQDLYVKLWTCSLSHDSKRGRFATLAYRAMLREYDNICELYLGFMPRNKVKNKGLVSLSTKIGEGMELGHVVALPGVREQGEAMDTRELVGIVKGVIGEDAAQSIINASYKARVMRRAEASIKDVRQYIDLIELIDPEYVNDIKESAGVCA